MKRTVRFAAIFIAALTVTRAGAVEFHVAPWGADTNSGSEQLPFGTFEAARDAVRHLTSSGLTEDVRILVKGGDYYLSETFTLGYEDSGTDDHSITYERTGDIPVRLLGAIEVSSWRRHEGSIWKAEIPGKAAIGEAFENGERLVAARWPNKQYLADPKKEDYLGVAALGDRSGKQFYYFDKHFPKQVDPAEWDVSEGRVLVWAGKDWYRQRNLIGEVDASRNLITMLTGSGVSQWNRYYVENILTLLDQPGECVISSMKGELYVWPRKSPIFEQEILLSSIDNILRIEGDDADYVKNVHFKGIDFSISRSHAVVLRNVSSCSVKDGIIENAGKCGVIILDHAVAVEVSGNLVQYSGWHGIALRGLEPGTDYASYENVIENNHVRYCGHVYGHAHGIHVRFSGGNKIRHNLVHHVPRFGIALMGLQYQSLIRRVNVLDRDDKYSYMYTKENDISYNEVHHVNLDSQDGAGIEVRNVGRDNALHHNLIHDVGSSLFTVQSGISLDDGADYVTVSENVILRVNGLSAYAIHSRGSHNIIRNNVMLCGKNYHAAARLGGWGTSTKDISFYRNIVVFDDAADLFLFVNWTGALLAECDHNVYWSSGSREFTVKGNPGGKSYEDWTGGREANDVHSLVSDPLFRNADDSDFRLDKESPALELGYKDFSVSGAGLRPAFPVRLPRD